MTQIISCPVCGTENTESFHVEAGWGEVRRLYSCKNCGYFHQISSRQRYRGIRAYFPEKYKNKVKDLGLQTRPISYCVA